MTNTEQNPLRAWMVDRGVKAKWIAEQAHVTPMTVSRWLRQAPRMRSRHDIARITNGDVPVDAWGEP